MRHPEHADSAPVRRAHASRLTSAGARYLLQQHERRRALARYAAAVRIDPAHTPPGMARVVAAELRERATRWLRTLTP